MAKKPLDILKEGLANLKDRVKARKNTLLARLQKKEKISDADEQWLDHDANLVDEEAIIDALEVEEKPARKEALTAAATLGKYISNINEPFARKLEAILASFGHQTRLEATRSLEPSFITDYFIRS